MKNFFVYCISIILLLAAAHITSAAKAYAWDGWNHRIVFIHERDWDEREKTPVFVGSFENDNRVIAKPIVVRWNGCPCGNCNWGCNCNWWQCRWCHCNWPRPCCHSECE